MNSSFISSGPGLNVAVPFNFFSGKRAFIRRVERESLFKGDFFLL